MRDTRIDTPEPLRAPVGEDKGLLLVRDDHGAPLHWTQLVRVEEDALEEWTLYGQDLHEAGFRWGWGELCTDYATKRSIYTKRLSLDEVAKHAPDAAMIANDTLGPVLVEVEGVIACLQTPFAQMSWDWFVVLFERAMNLARIKKREGLLTELRSLEYDIVFGHPDEDLIDRVVVLLKSELDNSDA
jgi:hypothetical protein